MEETLEQYPAPLARALAIPLRLWARLASLSGLLVTPLLAVLMTFLLWRVWRAAERSALARAFRWHAVFALVAVLAGCTVFVLGTPPDDPSEAAAARFVALERAGRPVYTTPLAAAGALAVALSTFAALRATWKARVPAADRAAARHEWDRLRARYGRRAAAIALTVAGGLLAAGGGAVAVASLAPAALPASAQDVRGLWVGTPRGASRFGAGGWEPVRRPWAALPSSQVTDIASGPSGEVWIATNGGLWRRTVDGQTLTAVVENAPLPYPTVLGVAVDRRGVAWAATVAGAAAVDGQRNGRAFNGHTAPLMHQLLDAAYVDRAGRVWFGGAGGVNVYEPPTTWSEPGRWPSGFNRWLTDGALPDSLVFTIFEDSRGRMWFGTDGGAAALSPDPSAYSLGSDQRARWQTFTTTSSPLLHDKTHAIAEDRQGRIYLGTESGVSIYDESALAERRWSAIDGSRLPHPYVDNLLAAPDGRMWIGTKNGLTVYDPRLPAAELPVYRAHPLRYWTGLFWAPHASLDVPANEITALAWSP